MKYFAAFLILTLLLAIPGIAQQNGTGDKEQTIKKTDMPKAVLAAFQESYPKAMVRGYTKENDQGTTVYEIESREGKTSRDISYSEDGTVLSIEESLSYGDLPKAARGAISGDYPKAKIGICEKITKGTTIEFEVHLRSGKKSIEIVFDEQGKKINEEKK